MKVLVTGSRGFIGKNLIHHLKELSLEKIYTYDRDEDENELKNLIKKSDVIFHLAGANRESSDQNFNNDNVHLSFLISNELVKSKSKKIFIFTSSIQSFLNNDYGKSKAKAEEYFTRIKNKNVQVKILNLTNIFGKWSKPNYNSVIATFCYNINHNKKIKINDPEKELKLIYIDDLISYFLDVISNFKSKHIPSFKIKPYTISLQDLADKLLSFKQNLNIGSTGVGIDRALYATFISFKPPKSFKYALKNNYDLRGNFVEIMKTEKSGQFSYFTANPGITRGGHYHHTKNEKFLVVKGKAKFCFKNILDNEIYNLEVSDQNPEVVETVPGWAHDITNIGNDILIVFLWANEKFDKENPDTYAMELKNEKT